MKQYKEYTFQLERLPEGMMPEDAFDLVADQLAAKGFESFEYDQEGLIGYLPANEDNFPEKGLFALAFPDVQCRYTSRMLPSETHYNAVWEREEAKPVIVANTLYIRAPHHPPCSGMLKEILIAPHDTFGTASHPTTRMMLEMLLEADLQGTKGADVGCGTGILGIAALLQGANDVTFIDTDGRAVANTSENLALNGLHNTTLLHGTLEEAHLADLDFLFANLHRNIIIEELPRYRSTLREGGSLLVSGFWQDQDAENVRTAATRVGFVPFNSRSYEGWSALGFYAH